MEGRSNSHSTSETETHAHASIDKLSGEAGAHADEGNRRSHPMDRCMHPPRREQEVAPSRRLLLRLLRNQSWPVVRNSSVKLLLETSWSMTCTDASGALVPLSESLFARDSLRLQPPPQRTQRILFIDASLAVQLVVAQFLHENEVQMFTSMRWLEASRARQAGGSDCVRCYCCIALSAIGEAPLSIVCLRCSVNNSDATRRQDVSRGRTHRLCSSACCCRD